MLRVAVGPLGLRGKVCVKERQVGLVPFEALAVYGHQSRDAGVVSAAARDAGLTVLDLPQDPASIDVVPAAGLAWRCPPGLAVYMHQHGAPLPVTGASGTWFTALPVDLTGRHLQVLTAQQLLTSDSTEMATMNMVKLAELKYRHFPAAHVQDVQHARSLIADLPSDTRLLVADAWLDCHSEYRVFCAAEQALTCSPYRIEDEIWSPELWMHRASFHEQALAFVSRALAELPPHDRPPGCVLDVARLNDGRLVLLEVNTSWGAGLYGCNPHTALLSVLAANRPADPKWTGRRSPEPPHAATTAPATTLP